MRSIPKTAETTLVGARESSASAGRDPGYRTQGALLQVENLGVSFKTPDGIVCAVNGLSLQLAPGETLGIV
ncbi:MAG: hypothetical protein ACRETM_07160, partial [Stenotrophobium sp.]